MDGYPSISLLDNSGALYLFLLILKWQKRDLLKQCRPRTGEVEFQRLPVAPLTKKPSQRNVFIKARQHNTDFSDFAAANIIILLFVQPISITVQWSPHWDPTSTSYRSFFVTGHFPNISSLARSFWGSNVIWYWWYCEQSIFEINEAKIGINVDALLGSYLFYCTSH